VPKSDDQIRDGLIQRFEFTYELSHKMIRRYLKEATASPDEIEQMPFADLVRIGNAQGLLRGDWPVWRRYREVRARTSHTYDAGVALEVAAAIPEFLEEAEHLWRTTAARRMTKPLVVDLRADHRRTVLDILHENLPLNTQAWVFGSRATGRARRHSDLDLAIDAGRRLTLDEIARLSEAFSDSDLPYKVDLLDWHAVDDRWRQMIVAERVPLPETAQPT
jgi:nucleotidyltransferase substrate binding protein (TIGR01987 family)